MSAYSLLDIAGGLLGPPLLAVLFSIPRRWRDMNWFLGWWLITASWVLFWTGLGGDGYGAISAAVSLLAGAVAAVAVRVRKRA